jgi:hypothetical protein
LGYKLKKKRAKNGLKFVPNFANVFLKKNSFALFLKRRVRIWVSVVHTLHSVVYTLHSVVRGLYTASHCVCDYLCIVFDSNRKKNSVKSLKFKVLGDFKAMKHTTESEHLIQTVLLN